MSQFIDGALSAPVAGGSALSAPVAGGSGAPRPPTEKQVAFANKLASERATSVPSEAFESSYAMSQFIDGVLQQGGGGGGGYGAVAATGNEETFCEVDLGNNRNVRVRTFAGRVMVDVREFYESREGGLLPTKKGIALNPDQWRALRERALDIDQAVEAAMGKKEPTRRL